MWSRVNAHISTAQINTTEEKAWRKTGGIERQKKFGIISRLWWLWGQYSKEGKMTVYLFDWCRQSQAAGQEYPGLENFQQYGIEILRACLGPVPVSFWVSWSCGLSPWPGFKFTSFCDSCKENWDLFPRTYCKSYQNMAEDTHMVQYKQMCTAVAEFFLWFQYWPIKIFSAYSWHAYANQRSAYWHLERRPKSKQHFIAELLIITLPLFYDQ